MNSHKPSKPDSKRLVRLHRFAGLTLATFIAIHLTNHLFALVSVEMHIKVMDIARLIYRNPLGEALLLAAIAVQVPSGIILVRRKGWRGTSGIERLQVASGLYLSFFLVVHVFAVMMGRWYFKLDTNFYFGSSPLLSWLWWYYVPYYGLSVIAVFAHVASIHFQKVLPRTSRKQALWQSVVLVVAGCVLSVLILLAFSGVLRPIVLPEQYKLF
ncbi:MAG: hypothetical protein MUF71_00860 [Candidatus Kapabacteria bacterium]|jgi:hypothetical protein|nr:hypothetical protein [Candidatus Kapabacteria bacterium]